MADGLLAMSTRYEHLRGCPRKKIFSTAWNREFACECRMQRWQWKFDHDPHQYDEERRIAREDYDPPEDD